MKGTIYAADLFAGAGGASTGLALAAHSFPRDYHFAGGREDRVKQVGNSWPVRMGAALCRAILEGGEKL